MKQEILKQSLTQEYQNFLILLLQFLLFFLFASHFHHFHEHHFFKLFNCLIENTNLYKKFCKNKKMNKLSIRLNYEMFVISYLK